MSPRWIDIAVNLTDPVFRGVYHDKQVHIDDIQYVLQRAWNAGIGKMIITGTSLQESVEALDLSCHDDRLYATVGCHPTRTFEWHTSMSNQEEDATGDAIWTQLCRLVEKGFSTGKLVAIGEMGLDYDRLHFSSKEIQKKYFEKQLNLVRYARLPLFLHCRNAFSDLWEIIDRNRELLNGIDMVFHSFTGTMNEAQDILGRGHYIGINGCSLKTEENLHVVTSIPLDRILLETDAPWCDIRPSSAGFRYLVSKQQDHAGCERPLAKEKFQLGCTVRGRNEPCFILNVAQIVSQLHQVSLDQLASQVYENSMSVFWRQGKSI